MSQSNTFDEHDFYTILDLKPDASLQEIKTAYRKALLEHHPDKSAKSVKSAKSSTTAPSQLQKDLDIIRLAYITLSNQPSRQEYDDSRTAHADNAEKMGPRPSNIVSLDDFEEKEVEDGIQWTYSCRCGGHFTLTEELLERDVHLVICDSCSEAIFVGYELQE